MSVAVAEVRYSSADFWCARSLRSVHLITTFYPCTNLQDLEFTMHTATSLHDDVHAYSVKCKESVILIGIRPLNFLRLGAHSPLDALNFTVSVLSRNITTDGVDCLQMMLVNVRHALNPPRTWL